MSFSSRTARSNSRLCKYDFSEIGASGVAADGRFHELDSARFDHGYFIQADGHLAGFALVNRKASRVIDGEAVWWMEAFCSALAAYAYEEVEFDDPRWGRRPLQRFSIP